MTKPLDPEIKAMRAVVRAMLPLDETAEKRALEWYIAHRAGRTWVHLPAFVSSPVAPSEETEISPSEATL